MMAKRLFIALCVSIGLAFAPLLAQAADFPTKRVNLIIWSGTGGTLDIYGRELSRLLEEKAGWETTVQNRPGGTGAIGMAYIMAQPADGHNILVLTSSLEFGIARGIIPYKLDDIRLVRAMEGEVSSVAVRADSKWQSMHDLVRDLAAHPEQYKVGGHGAGGFNQYMWYQIQQEAKIKTGWVPFDSSGKVALNLLGDHINVASMTPSTGLSQLEAGSIKLLGVAADERLPLYPDVPTLKEQGLNVVGGLWRGVAVKAGTPEAVVSAIQAALDKVQDSDEWKRFIQQQKQQDLRLSDQAFHDSVAQAIEHETAFLKEAGLMK